jgi:Tol biopolymer transport system component
LKCPKCHSENPDTSRFCSNCATQLTHAGPLSDSLTKTLETLVHALANGTLVAGKYRVIGEIGRGGMGVVYRAHDEALARDVAIKVLPPEFASDSERLRRFEQEAKAAGQLNHPNILVVYDVGTHKGAPYIVTELLEGESLRERLSSGALPVRKATETTVQIAQGLSAAHEKGIIHRDLKPDNVFLTKDGHVKILDFGLAKLARSRDEFAGATLTEATQAGTVLGTVGYMSPEQVLGKPLDARSDLFSLGVVLYEMVSGTRPFHKASAPETMTAILKEEPPDLAAPGRSVPPGLDRIIRHCLEKEPSSRFQSARDIAFALESLTQSTTAGTASLRAAGGKRRLTVVALGLTVIATCAAFFFMLGKRTGRGPAPSFQRLTFRRGWVNSARFAPDGQTVVYSAAWEGGPNEVFNLRLGSPESRPLGFSPAELLAISPMSELALSLNSHSRRSFDLWAGTLARVPFSGGTPRPLGEQVTFADWSPDGKEMALVRETDTADQLEYPVGHVLYSSGGSISHPRVSPKGDLVAFLDLLDSFSGSVAVVDRTGKKTTLTETFMGGATGLAWSPKGDEIWFTAGAGLRHELRAVTLGGRQRLVLSQAVSIRLLDVAKDGRVLVAHEQQRIRCFFRGEKDPTDRELSWLDYSAIQSLSRDGRFVILNEQGEGAGADLEQTYLRETSGAPPMKLGKGIGAAFSPDERFVVAQTADSPPDIVLYPVGPGQPRTIHVEGVSLVEQWGLLPDGRTVVFTGIEPQHGIRIWLMDLSGSKPRPITAEGVNVLRPIPITPDGKFVLGVSGGLGLAGGKILAYPVAGGEPRHFKGLLDGEEIAGWCRDGQSFFAFGVNRIPMNVSRVDGKTGERKLVREIVPTDRAGRLIAFWAYVTPDGKDYAYSTNIWFSELHLIEGLR